MKRGVKFSRNNVFARDDFRCQYCGARKSARELNYDHVVPRVQGGKTVWENIVASCYDCNGMKRGRTPEQAGMKLLRAPVKPRSLPMTTLFRADRPFLFLVRERRTGATLLLGRLADPTT